MEKEKHTIPLKTMDRFTSWVLFQKIVAKLQQMGMLEKKREKRGGNDGQIGNTERY